MTDNAPTAYDNVRRPEYSTLGDSYRMCRQDPEAFVAGVQYALDKVNNTSSGLAEIVGINNPGLVAFMDQWSAEILQRAIDAEPQ